MEKSLQALTETFFQKYKNVLKLLVILSLLAMRTRFLSLSVLANKKNILCFPNDTKNKCAAYECRFRIQMLMLLMKHQSIKLLSTALIHKHNKMLLVAITVPPVHSSPQGKSSVLILKKICFEAYMSSEQPELVLSSGRLSSQGRNPLVLLFPHKTFPR